MPKHTGQEQQDAGVRERHHGEAEVDLPRAAGADQHAGQRDGDHEHHPDAGVHEGEHPPADLVADLTAEQRDAGQERHPGTGTDQQRAHDSDGQVDGDREHDHADGRRA